MTQRKIIETARARIAEELDEIDTAALYDSFLDEIHRENLTGPFKYMSPSKLLRENDETEYRTGYNDWLDGETRDERFAEIEDKYYEPGDVVGVVEEMIDELNEQVDELNTVIDDADSTPEEIESAEDQLSAVEADIEALEAEFNV